MCLSTEQQLPNGEPCTWAISISTQVSNRAIRSNVVSRAHTIARIQAFPVFSFLFSRWHVHYSNNAGWKSRSFSILCQFLIHPVHGWCWQYYQSIGRNCVILIAATCYCTIHSKRSLKTFAVLNACLKLLTRLQSQTKTDDTPSLTSLPSNFFLIISTTVFLLTFLFCSDILLMGFQSLEPANLPWISWAVFFLVWSGWLLKHYHKSFTSLSYFTSTAHLILHLPFQL